MSLTGATASVLAFHVFESEYPATELFFFLCKKKRKQKHETEPATDYRNTMEVSDVHRL